MASTHFKTPAGPVIPPAVIAPVEPPPPPAAPATVDCSSMPGAFFVPSNWHIQSTDGVIRGRNNVTGHSYEGTMLGFNAMLTKAAT